MKLSKEIKIGFYIVVVLTASFFLINYLRGEDIFNKEIELKDLLLLHLCISRATRLVK